MSLMMRKFDKNGFLDGQLLIAMPSMGDSRFARTVIYLCAHSGEGAMGIIVNKIAPDVEFADLLVQLGIAPTEGASEPAGKADAIRVHRGGPVETGRGFVLHSA